MNRRGARAGGARHVAGPLALGAVAGAAEDLHSGRWRDRETTAHQAGDVVELKVLDAHVPLAAGAAAARGHLRPTSAGTISICPNAIRMLANSPPSSCSSYRASPVSRSPS